MNTVDALLELGKALCGNDFELAPNMTDAEAIREIARNYQPPEGGGSGEDEVPLFIDTLVNAEFAGFVPGEHGTYDSSYDYYMGKFTSIKAAGDAVDTISDFVQKTGTPTGKYSSTDLKVTRVFPKDNGDSLYRMVTVGNSKYYNSICSIVFLDFTFPPYFNDVDSGAQVTAETIVLVESGGHLMAELYGTTLIIPNYTSPTQH